MQGCNSPSRYITEKLNPRNRGGKVCKKCFPKWRDIQNGKEQDKKDWIKERKAEKIPSETPRYVHGTSSRRLRTRMAVKGR